MCHHLSSGVSISHVSAHDRLVLSLKSQSGGRERERAEVMTDEAYQTLVTYAV